MQAIEKIRNIFAQVAHRFGFYDERSRHTRLTGVMPFTDHMSDEKIVTEPSQIKYFLKIYPDLDGVKGNLAMLFEGGGLSIPRYMVMSRGPVREENYCHILRLGRMPMAEAREVLACFDSGKMLTDFLPHDAFDYELVHSICDGEEKYGVTPIHLSPAPNHVRPNFKELGFK